MLSFLQKFKSNPTNLYSGYNSSKTNMLDTKFFRLVVAFSLLLGGIAVSVRTVSAQENVGIGTKTPHGSSVLDLSIDLLSTPKGFLAPRMTAAQKNSIASPAKGLLIYQTDGAQGFYYFDGTLWLPFGGLNSTDIAGIVDSVGWSLKGNKNISSTNFLGTTDQRDLIVKTNNTERLRVSAIGDVSVSSLSTGGFVKALPGGVLVLAGTNEVESPLTFSNGLSRSGNNVLLGGNLTQNTVLTLNNNNFVLSGNGNLGVGVDNPNLRLEVAGTPGTPSVKVQSLSGTGTRIVTANANGELTTLNSSLVGGNVVSGTGTPNLLTKWAPDGISLLNSQVFDNGTNVGVGTVNPASMFSVGATSQFQVNNNGAITAATGITSSGNIQFGSLSTGGMVKSDPVTGRLSVATPGLDFEKAIIYMSGLSRTGDTVRLGGALTQSANIPLAGNNLTLSSSGDAGNIIIGKFTTSGIVKNSATGVLSSGKIDLANANEVTGTVSVINGGTGNSIVGPAGTVAYSDGTKITYSPAGTTGQILQSNGTGSPTWTSVGSLIKTGNGVSTINDSVQLGGALTKNLSLIHISKPT